MKVFRRSDISSKLLLEFKEKHNEKILTTINFNRILRQKRNL
jgi:hypothetical protein